MEISGKVKVVNLACGNEKYEKSELVVTTDEQYPQSILIEFGGTKASMLDAIEVGQDVKVSINLGGREWVNPQGETKYFNSVKGWKIEAVSTF